MSGYSGDGLVDAPVRSLIFEMRLQILRLRRGSACDGTVTWSFLYTSVHKYGGVLSERERMRFNSCNWPTFSVLKRNCATCSCSHRQTKPSHWSSQTRTSVPTITSAFISTRDERATGSAKGESWGRLSSSSVGLASRSHPPGHPVVPVASPSGTMTQAQKASKTNRFAPPNRAAAIPRAAKCRRRTAMLKSARTPTKPHHIYEFPKSARNRPTETQGSPVRTVPERHPPGRPE
jgi:hypothetical protein